MILKIYYSRNKYNLVLKKGYGIERVTGENEYYYGTEVKIDSEPKPGYTWSKWSTNSEKILESRDKEYTIIIPNEDVTLTAEATLNTYTITYDLAFGKLEEGIENKTEYTVETESFTINNPTRIGYTFKGWKESDEEELKIEVTIEKGTTGNKAFTANWIANKNTKYVVQTYEMDLNGEYAKTKEEEKEGETDTIVSITPEEKEGFNYEIDLSIVESNIEPDGSTILKIYYSRNKYNLILEMEYGI